MKETKGITPDSTLREILMHMCENSMLGAKFTLSSGDGFVVVAIVIQEVQ